MSTTAVRAMQWIGFVGDLLRQPLTRMPHQAVVDQLRQTFDVTAASYNWAEADGSQGIFIRPCDTLAPLAEEFLAWQRGEFVGRHPLITWHQTVGGSLPWTNERVPLAVVSGRERQPLIALQKTIGCEHQLAINYRLGRHVYHSYVMTRAGTDFTDEDLAVAGQIQRAVIGLDHQVVAYQELHGTTKARGVEAGLTPRELCILNLVAEGLATATIARRLVCSPRTVSKHLERIYRKLGVGDRVNALRVARHWEVITQPTTSPAPVAPRPVAEP